MLLSNNPPNYNIIEQLNLQITINSKKNTKKLWDHLDKVAIVLQKVNLDALVKLNSLIGFPPSLKVSSKNNSNKCSKSISKWMSRVLPTNSRNKKCTVFSSSSSKKNMNNKAKHPSRTDSWNCNKDFRHKCSQKFQRQTKRPPLIIHNPHHNNH